MNQDQAMSFLRGILIALGAVAAYGGISDATWAQIAGAITTVAPIAWGVYEQSKARKIASVSAMPEVKAMTLSDQDLAGAARQADASTVVTLVKPKATVQAAGAA